VKGYLKKAKIIDLRRKARAPIMGAVRPVHDCEKNQVRKISEEKAIEWLYFMYAWDAPIKPTPVKVYIFVEVTNILNWVNFGVHV
jgi:hypothetical protein